MRIVRNMYNVESNDLQYLKDNWFVNKNIFMADIDETLFLETYIRQILCNVSKRDMVYHQVAIDINRMFNFPIPSYLENRALSLIAKMQEPVVIVSYYNSNNLHRLLLFDKKNAFPIIKQRKEIISEYKKEENYFCEITNACHIWKTENFNREKILKVSNYGNAFKVKPNRYIWAKSNIHCFACDGTAVIISDVEQKIFLNILDYDNPYLYTRIMLKPDEMLMIEPYCNLPS